MIAWVTAKLAGFWIRVGLALVALITLAGIVLAIVGKLLGAGRAAQRADDADNVAKRTRAATQARIEAMKPVTPEQEKADEAHDPFNRDRQ